MIKTYIMSAKLIVSNIANVAVVSICNVYNVCNICSVFGINNHFFLFSESNNSNDYDRKFLPDFFLHLKLNKSKMFNLALSVLGDLTTNLFASFTIRNKVEF